jgi:hypothetical protein
MAKKTGWEGPVMLVFSKEIEELGVTIRNQSLSTRDLGRDCFCNLLLTVLYFKKLIKNVLMNVFIYNLHTNVTIYSKKNHKEFLFNKIRERGQNRFCLEAGVGVGRGDRRRGEVAQTMDIHVSKCKNDKIKERKKNHHKEVFSTWRGRSREII